MNISHPFPDRITPQMLLDEAKKARERSYAPYSHCRVGAALLTRSGEIIHGCNIENAAFSPTVCAERVAIFKAISQGATSGDFVAIAVVGGTGSDTAGAFPPCGVCRQVLREFCDPDTFRVVLEPNREDAEPVVLLLSALLPHSFGPDFL